MSITPILASCNFGIKALILVPAVIACLTVVNSFPYPSLSQLSSSPYKKSPKCRSLSWTKTKAVLPPIRSSISPYDIEADDDGNYEESIEFGSRTVRNSQPSQPPFNSDPSQPQRTILVIDDEQSIRTAVAAYLTSSMTPPCKVTTFSSAESALEHLESTPLSSPALPSAIVSDIRMDPGMDGIQFVSTLRRFVHRDSKRRAYYGTVPVVMLTAKGSVKDRIRGWEVGCDGYLPKPFEPEELVGMLEGFITRYEFMRQRALEEAEGGEGGVEGLRKDLKEIRDMILMDCMDDGGGGADGHTDGNDSVTNDSEVPAITTSEGDEANDSVVVLSMDELDVLELLCQGKMNKEMALELKYSIRWVEGHLTSMYRKTGCSNRTELVRWAVAMGYVDMFGD